MNPLRAERVAVIVAAIDARATAEASVAGFVREVVDRGEVILVDASRDWTAGAVARRFPDVRVLRRPPGLLAPHLWRDGLEATDAPLVAFTTAQMVPRSGWLDRMVERLEETGAAAVGGPIEPADALSPADRALFLLRYVHYLGDRRDENRPGHDDISRARSFGPWVGSVAPARSAITLQGIRNVNLGSSEPRQSIRFSGAPVEPAGDNALYRRDRLAGLEALWAGGFWEVEIHRVLRDRGEVLALASGAVVEFLGGMRFLNALRQRRAHARYYGASRSGRMGMVERVSRSVAAPVVPAVLLRRIAAALGKRGMSLRPWAPALPYLALLMAAWSEGEFFGTWLGPPAERPGAA